MARIKALSRWTRVGAVFNEARISLDEVDLWGTQTQGNDHRRAKDGRRLSGKWSTVTFSDLAAV